MFRSKVKNFTLVDNNRFQPWLFWNAVHSLELRIQQHISPLKVSEVFLKRKAYSYFRHTHDSS